MKLVIRLANPQNDKEKIFRLEVPIEDIRNPGVGEFFINGKAYNIEVHYYDIASQVS